MRIVTNSIQLEWLKKLHLVERVSEQDLLTLWYDGDVYGVIIIDLDRVSGLPSVRKIRCAGPSVPLIGFSSRLRSEFWSSENARFLELGGDYLLRSPLCRQELMACIGALKRRFCVTSSVLQLYGKRVLLNTNTFTIQTDGQPLRLTPKQTCVLMDLALHYRQIRSPTQILFSVFETAYAVENARTTVSSYIKRIRRQLDDRIPGARELIQTSYGQGYFLSDVLNPRTPK